MLVARGVRKKFGARAVLRGAQFKVPHGQVCAIAGRNGAGKSTLLRVVAGVLRADEGSVRWQHESGGDELGSETWRLKCGLCAPDAPLYRELSCGENLLFWSQARGESRSAGEKSSEKSSEKYLRAHLERWELGSRWGDPAGSLSSGLRARLGLAVATLHAPEILLLDEPGANLDEDGRALLRRALEEQRERGVVLLASNDPRELALCDESVALS
jgi:heme exporter protein A